MVRLSAIEIIFLLGVALTLVDVADGTGCTATDCGVFRRRGNCVDGDCVCRYPWSGADCDTKLQCPDQEAADQDCVQSQWSLWTPCSSTCGSGTRSRSMPIITQPSGNGQACWQPEQESCNLGPCPCDATLPLPQCRMCVEGYLQPDPSQMGSFCDDGDPDTINDICLSSGDCNGEPDPCVDVDPNLVQCRKCMQGYWVPDSGQVGNACDDDNPDTINDICYTNGGCFGTPV